jgi:uncharacterized protein (TIGR03067 family)
MFMGVVVVAAMVGCQQGGGKQDGSGSGSGSDVARIQGEWVFDSVTENGEKLPDAQMAEVKSSKAVITADKVVIKRPGHGDIENTYKIDSSKTPKEIDITEVRHIVTKTGAASDVPYVNKSIYVLDGDTLTICSPKDDDPRPAEMVSKKGNGASLVIFKRAK